MSNNNNPIDIKQNIKDIINDTIYVTDTEDLTNVPLTTYRIIQAFKQYLIQQKKDNTLYRECWACTDLIIYHLDKLYIKKEEDGSST